MAYLLRRIVAAPRRQHSDQHGTLDLGYITPQFIVTSMPVSGYIRSWYRHSVGELRSFLVRNHGDNWTIYNLRAERDGDYRDEEFSGKVHRYPFPDHGPPPFNLIPEIVFAIDDYLKSDDKCTAVVHCKAGQGRSGTIACAYLMYAQSLTKEDAIDKFTIARMVNRYRLKGVSIESQIRYLGYMERYIQKIRESPGLVLAGGYFKIEYIQITMPNTNNEIEIEIEEFVRNGQAIHVVYKMGPSNITVQSQDIIEYRPSKEQFQHKLKEDIGLKIITRAITKRTHTKLWFNCLFEDHLTQIFTATWNQTDGFLGTKLRGLKLFDEIRIRWQPVHLNLLLDESTTT